MASELATLIASGRLRVGDTLYHPRRPRTGGGEITARVLAHGIEVNGKAYNSLSTAAGSIAGHAVNGWTYWRVRPSGALLASLRRSAED